MVGCAAQTVDVVLASSPGWTRLQLLYTVTVKKRSRQHNFDLSQQKRESLRETTFPFVK